MVFTIPSELYWEFRYLKSITISNVCSLSNFNGYDLMDVWAKTTLPSFNISERKRVDRIQNPVILRPVKFTLGASHIY